MGPTPPEDRAHAGPTTKPLSGRAHVGPSPQEDSAHTGHRAPDTRKRTTAQSPRRAHDRRKRQEASISKPLLTPDQAS